MENSSISWTENTLNFWWGCWKISRGCRLCYAQVLNMRFKRGEWGKGTKRGWIKSAIKNALKWNRKAIKKGQSIKVFVNSMSDTFEDHPSLDAYRKIAFETMKKCKHLEFLLLTKRSANIKDMLPADFFNGEYSHVHLGVTCEAKEYLSRLDDLRAIPDWGGLRWVSYEPAQEEIHTEANLSKIDWLIYGGESSGSNNYTKDSDEWAFGIQKLCKLTGTVFFYKQSSGLAGRTKEELGGNIIMDFPDWRKNLISLTIRK